MKTILCFGDSNTWGWNPNDMSRFPPDQRWPGILQSGLGQTYKVIEEGLPGRTTVREDPFYESKNGKIYLIPCLYSHSPIDLVILMLGSNDLKSYFSLNAFEIAMGAGALVTIISQCEHGPFNSAPQVLLVAPPQIDPHPGSDLDTLFAGGKEKSRMIGQYFSKVAIDKNCYFLDAGTITKPSPVDGVHLDVEGHRKLGMALLLKVQDIFARLKIV